MFEQTVRTSLARKYSVEVDSIILKKPKGPYGLRGKDVKVQVWQLKVPISTQGARQMVKIEVANVSAYQTEPRIWPAMTSDSANMAPSPTVILNVESRAEIMADKIVALACRNHIKHRDIWDYHMLKAQGIVAHSSTIIKKFRDYGISHESLRLNIKEKLSAFSDKEELVKKFWQEMKRFVFPETALQMVDQGFESEMISSAQMALNRALKTVERDLSQGAEL